MGEALFQMDDNAKGELLKKLMAHNVMGGGREFLAKALLLLDPEELKNCRQVSFSSRMSVTVCVSIDYDPFHNQHYQCVGRSTRSGTS